MDSTPGLRFAMISTLAAALGVACGGSVDVAGTGGTTTSSTSSMTTNATSTTGVSSTSTVTSTTTAASTSSSSSGAIVSGDCSTDADCGGTPCVPLLPGGYKVCLSFPPEATSCSIPKQPQDECCSSKDCATGRCYSTASIPSCSGGPVMIESNRCLADSCAGDADCPSTSFCAPAGAFGYPTRTCRLARCRTNADCTVKPGGVCAPVDPSCCNVPFSLACVYPGGCRGDADCAGTPVRHCALDPATQAMSCAAGAPLCPL